MRLTLISHASVLIGTGNGGPTLWTDPWLFGTAFNDSWSLCPPAVWDPRWLAGITHVWISHEHPDHFHVRTLKSLPIEFKRRVTLLFQEQPQSPLPRRLRELGFQHIVLLAHRRRHSLGSGCFAYCYREGPLNSCLAVGSGDQVVLDVNDARLSRRDCRTIHSDLGPPAVILNQFSLAGYSGEADRDAHLPRRAREVLGHLSDTHRELQAKVTVPFASFVRFCQSDNDYMNAHANSVGVAEAFMRARGQSVAVLAPGDTLEVGAPHRSAPAIARLGTARAACLAAPLGRAPTVPITEIAAAFHALTAQLHEHYPAVLLRRLRPVRVQIPDLSTQVVFSIEQDRLEEVAGGLPDLAIHSQPLHFAFAHPFGLQTLGVSARLQLFRNARNWRRHRILFALNQAGLPLAPFSAALHTLSTALPSLLPHLLRRLRDLE